MALHRRKVCNVCEFNSLNAKTVSLRNKLLKVMSDILSWILRRENEDLGQCTRCGCDIYWKSIEEDEKCPKKRWAK